MINYICSVEPEDTIKQTHQGLMENFQRKSVWKLIFPTKEYPRISTHTHTLCVHWGEETYFAQTHLTFMQKVA